MNTLHVLAAFWWIVPATLTATAGLALMAWTHERQNTRTRAHRLPSWRLLGEAPDPGNPGQVVRLLERPGRVGRWVEVRNGTPPHAPFLLPVDAGSLDPIRALAATYGMTRTEYLACEKRT